MCRESFEKAKNDGERWRWALPRRPRSTRACSTRPLAELADFCSSQFGTQTIAEFGFPTPDPATAGPRTPGIFALDTLKDDETIARLATGIKRFTLPDEFNPIKIYQAIADEPGADQGEQALVRSGDDLREPPPVRPGGRVPAAKQGRVRRPETAAKAAAARPDPRQLGPVRGRDDPAGRARGDRRLPLPQRPPVHFEAHEIMVDKLLTTSRSTSLEAARSSTGSRSTSATSARGWSR